MWQPWRRVRTAGAVRTRRPPRDCARAHTCTQERSHARHNATHANACTPPAHTQHIYTHTHTHVRTHARTHAHSRRPACLRGMWLLVPVPFRHFDLADVRRAAQMCLRMLLPPFCAVCRWASCWSASLVPSHRYRMQVGRVTVRTCTCSSAGVGWFRRM